jgi:hypothetical protein
MKTKLQNTLIMHLELIIQMSNQKFFTLQDFHAGETIQNWKHNKTWYGL